MKATQKQKTLFKFVQHNFDWDVSELDAYVDEQSQEIYPELVKKSPTVSLITTMENVKGKEKIKLISTEANLQAASSCGFNADGGVILTDKTIEVERIKIEEDYCNEDLNETWGQIVLAAGAQNQDEEIPGFFANVMMALYVKKAAARTETLIWKGDTDSVNTNLLYIDGFVKLFSADTDMIEANDTGIASITDANAMTILQRGCDKVPTEVLDEGNVIAVGGRETYNKALNELYDDNKYHYKLDEDEGRSFLIPTKRIRFHHVEGLDGTDRIYFIPTNLTFFGTDLSGDIDNIRMWYSQDDDKIKISLKWRVGVQYVYSQYFVKFTTTQDS